MKRIALLSSLVALTFIASCKKNEDEVSTPSSPTAVALPVCIQSIIDSSNGALSTVQVQELMNEDHYWLNTNALFGDGDEYIVNDQCDTVCVMAGWFPNPCQSTYADSLWTVVWEN